eukprot:TRINITY_DN18592_c0_g1_i1.p1 TRINITY_DN18592_c0_g1~~TRINITY_DN18592_c0_g1_i1.p1  ORF type:complete len:1240 (+),score=272.61 TRINITY_DN18592_c0_g1_i1:100-3819(+)
MAASFRGHDYSQAVPPELQRLAAPHIDSFNHLISQGLQDAWGSLEPVETALDTAGNRRLRIWVERPVVYRPVAEDGSRRKVLPSECRESAKTYKGELKGNVLFEVNGGFVHRIPMSFGKLPIMVKSRLCFLEGLSQKELIAKGEESLEMGGYFICNGIERIIRLLILPKANYVLALRRSAFLKKGKGFSDMATMIRCVRPDRSSVTMRVIYVQGGTAMLSFSYRKNEYFIPVAIILKALIEASDREIYEHLVASCVGSEGQQERALLLLHEAQKKKLHTRNECLAFLGQNFRAVLQLPEHRSNAFVGAKLLKECVLVHLQHPQDKFNLLIFMLHKLFALVDGHAQEDNADALQHHDLLLPGHLIAIVLKERVQTWLLKVAEQCAKDAVAADGGVSTTERFLRKSMDKCPANFGQAVEMMLSTGNLASPSGLDLQQVSGFTVVAEKLNFLRYLSHFRSVHRGAYFAQLRTTAVRKLLPESWGFMCPVHTPDGSPCGLLNHLALPCLVTGGSDTPRNTPLQSQQLQPREGGGGEVSLYKAVARVLAAHGMQPIASNFPPREGMLPVLLEGCVLGHMGSANVEAAVAELRRLKVTLSEIPENLEVGLVPSSPMGTFPGLFLFGGPARMVRPVRQLPSTSTNGVSNGTHASSYPLELIGPFEQVYMRIRCPDGGKGGLREEAPTAPRTGVGPGQEGGGEVATHEEISPTAMLSVVASLTPWSDYNQSPRNMYQCQMGKQTMGVPMQALPHRTDNKFYLLQTPQTPVARTETYRAHRMDDFPTGTNAVVAVLAYTGYDMEDAMIINKSAMERGFAHGHIYKTEQLNLAGSGGNRKARDTGQVFGLKKRAGGQQAASGNISSDGLPYVGQKIAVDEEYYSVLNVHTGATKAQRLKGSEAAIVDQVTLLGTTTKEEPFQKANIRMRYGRNPVIGDKFSSRHGQKGVLSQLWPDIDMPFSHATGMRPDIIINPHAFPSRMTIGMLVESMAAKSGSLDGSFVNATSFRSSMKDTPPLHWPSDSGSGPRHQNGASDDPMSSTVDADVSRDGNGANSESIHDEFGRRLAAKGFNYCGTEVMYSGVLGTELTYEIFMGVVYYQRLRHMVSDKFQVRSTGPVNPLTQQPVKGRKLGGGIRFGEMERDALLSHGASFLLHDRLHKSSDYHIADVCSLCGSLLSPWIEPQARDPVALLKLGGGASEASRRRRVTCHLCNTGRGIERVAMPFVFKYLAAELAAMNIKVTLGLQDA